MNDQTQFEAVGIASLLTIAIPILAAAFAWVARRGAASVAVAAATASFVGALYAWFARTAEATLTLATPGAEAVSTSVRLDTTTALQSLVVSITALLIFVYALDYMRGKGQRVWFWAALSLFLGAMQMMVFSANWFTFILGWEIMGATSYLLIAIHHEKADARSGATKAFMITRSTDMALYFGIFAFYQQRNTLSFNALENGDKLPLFASLALLVAAMGKAAQVPFQSWLKGAMAGPTPVSALLHSATMVSAGALLLIKAYPLFNHEALVAVAVIGSGTIILAGMTAIAAKDLKKMLAASTSSQLGFMLLAIGAESPGAALAHWIAHAFMKSGLFLAAGALQQRFGDTSFDRLSGSGRTYPAAGIGFVVTGLALVGIPPLIGYYSKDGILAATEHSAAAAFHFPLALIGAALTALYIGKALGELFRKDASGQMPAAKKAPMPFLLIGVGGFALLVVAGGFVLKSAIKHAGLELPESMLSKLLGLAVAAAGLATGWFLYRLAMSAKAWQYSRDHYPIAGGYESLVVKPVVTMAAASRVFDDLLHRSVFGIAHGVRVASFVAGKSDQTQDGGVRTIGPGGEIRSGYRGDRSIERLLASGVEQTGRLTLNLSGHAGERRLIRAVDRIGGLARDIGERSRKLQSGLTHKELMLSTGGLAVGIVAVILTLYLR